MNLNDFQSRPIYKDLTREIVAKTKDKDLGLLIFDNIRVDGDRDIRGIIDSLTPAQRAFYVIWIIEKEVNNGGFNQFYFNSSGQLADLGEEAFRRIGAHQFSELIRDANEIHK